MFLVIKKKKIKNYIKSKSTYLDGPVNMDSDSFIYLDL